VHRRGRRPRPDRRPQGRAGGPAAGSDIDTLLDTASTEKATVRLCRSLAIDLDADICFENGPELPLDSS